MRKFMNLFSKHQATPFRNKLSNIGSTFLILLVFISLLYACGKDTSSDSTPSTTPVATVATGSLKLDSTTNTCFPSSVSGVYVAGTKLNSINYLEITVNVKKTGTYSITTPSVNGYYFTSSGTIKDSGLNTIKLYGVGTPGTAGVNTFAVTFSGTTCYINVTVAAVVVPTAFTFNCSGTKLNGDYYADSTVNASNYISLALTVTSVGAYNITTDSVNGIIFKGAGNFTTKGAQTITLLASGKPTVVGSFNYNVTSGTSTCAKTVTFSHK